MSSNEPNEVQVQSMQKEVVLHQLVVDLWHNLLEDALDTGSLYGFILHTALNQGGGGNRKKRGSERGKKRGSNSETLSAIAEDRLQKNTAPQIHGEAACISHIAKDSALAEFCNSSVNEAEM